MTTVGQMLKHWREQRHLSQLTLSIDVGVSARHLSFVETGRSKPSRDMVLRLAEHLDVPLRDRNQLLLAGGFSPVFQESALDTPRMSSVRSAIRQLLTAHEPFPAVVIDRHWYMVDANAGLTLMTSLVAPHLLEPPVNVLRASLHPEGLAPHIVNLGEWRSHLLTRLRRQATLTGDPFQNELLEELRGYSGEHSEPEVELPGAADVVTPLRIRTPTGTLSFFGTIATFGTPADITVAELAIESFFPADAQTSEFLRAMS